MIAVRSRRALLVLLALTVASMLAGCAAVTPAPKTSAVFAAAPWRGGERHEYRLLNSAGEEIGRGVLTTKVEGDRLVLGQLYTGTRVPEGGGEPVRDEVALTVEAGTLRPVQGVRSTSGGATGTQPSRTTWEYGVDAGKTRLATRVERSSGKPEEHSQSVRDLAYDNESALWLWRGIAFAEGYDESYASMNPFERTQQTVSLRVPQREQIEVPAGKFDAWRILLRNGRAVRTAWISSTSPHQIVRWDNGDVIFELMKSE